MNTNDELLVRLIDKEDNLLEVISKSSASLLYKNKLAELVVMVPPTVRFLGENWNNKLLNYRNIKKTFRYKKNDHYGNYEVQSLDGQTMFYTGFNRILWYLIRDLLDVVSDNPPIFKLKFEPRGKGHHKNEHVQDEFYLKKKFNRCVVCGKENEITLHHVVPRVFRRHLPKSFKTFKSHDVVILCVDCHAKYEVAADAYKVQICNDLEVDMNIGIPTPAVLPPHFHASKAAYAILNYPIPEQKKNILCEVIKNYLKKEPTHEDLVFLSNLSLKSEKRKFQNYGKYVIEKTENLKLFCENWRKHFIDVMNPQFLPELWDVNHE